MRDEDYKQKLTEVCEWEIPVNMDTEQGRENRKLKLKRAGLNSYNPTYPLKLVKVKHQPQPCKDCGKIVEGRHKEMHMYKYKNIRGFKEKCSTCGLHKNPYTGEFTCESGSDAARLWLDYAKFHTYNNKKD